MTEQLLMLCVLETCCFQADSLWSLGLCTELDWIERTILPESVADTLADAGYCYWQHL